MIQIKKTILTLVALLAVTTGAWAQEETLLTTITPTAKEQASYSTANVATVSFSYTADGSSAYLANWGWWGYGWIATVTAAEGYTITKCKFYDDADRTATDSEAPFVVETTEEDKTPRINGTPIDGGNQWSKGIKKIEVYGYVTPAAPTGPEVAWDKATKTGTFTMPGGNVTLEPEYYPQAALTAAPTAINDVPATTDGAIVKAGTVANIGTTETAQGTVMYYVSPTALDDAALLALAADQWKADVPTAEKLAKGEAYVYYYVRGNDSDTDAENFSDGDILAANALQVTLGAAPLWNAEFDLTDAPEADKTGKWSTNIPEGGVMKGTEVTVTYSGTKKVIGVKAEKKAAAPASTPLDNTTTAWSAGTFTVPAGGLTYSDAITVSGDVTLTLTDGETLTLNKGISLASGATLTIQGNGTMNVNGTNGNTSSTVGGNHGTLILTSGTLNAKGGNGGNIGNDTWDAHGGNGGVAINGSVTVSGGTLTAIGGNGGNIGNDSWNSHGGDGGDAISGTLTINGGSTSVNVGSNGSIGNDSLGSTAGKGGKAVAGTVTDNR